MPLTKLQKKFVPQNLINMFVNMFLPEERVFSIGKRTLSTRGEGAFYQGSRTISTWKGRGTLSTSEGDTYYPGVGHFLPGRGRGTLSTRERE